MPTRIIIVCATSIATSTHIANRIRDICKEHGIDAVVTQARAMDCIPKASRLSEEYDFAIATVEMPKTCDIPVVNGAPFISGIGERQTVETIVELLREK